MIVGFTGTQNGMRYKQAMSVQRVMQDLRMTCLHHGDCIGADEEAHKLSEVIRLSSVPFQGSYVVIHPPEDKKKQAGCGIHGNGARERRCQWCAPKPYLERNQDIVDATEALIVAPNGFAKKERSGTWATYRRGMRKFRERNSGYVVVLVWPDGRVEYK